MTNNKKTTISKTTVSKTNSREHYKRIAKQLTNNLLSTSINTVFFMFALVSASFGKSKTSVGAHQMFEDAIKLLNDFDTTTVNNSIRYLKKQKFIRYQSPKDKRSLEITQEGWKRIEQMVPSYKTSRPWNGKVFLITYDIPEKKRTMRDTLRKAIKDLGAGMLQHSVWLTPYDPRGVLKDFINTQKLAGVVLISDMGHDASIGAESLDTLVQRVYKLEELNNRYKRFIDDFPLTHSVNPHKYTEYLSILQDDPQLPFELLPSWWLGDRAYKLLVTYQPPLTK